jgi:hypothetical protein
MAIFAAVVVAKDMLILDRVGINPLFPWAGTPGTKELRFATCLAALLLWTAFLPVPWDRGGKSCTSSSSRGAAGMGIGPLVGIGTDEGEFVL